MTTHPPTFEQIRAEVSAIRRRDPEAKVFGLHSTEPWTGPDMQEWGGETYWIRQCNSWLQLSAALNEDVPTAGAKVLVTPLANEAVNLEIRVRLARRRLHSLRLWSIVQELFQAQSMDPRIAKHSWMSELLIAAASPQGYTPTATGYLDLDTAWGVILREKFGLDAEQLDSMGLLRWSMQKTNVDRFRAAAAEVRQAMADWLAEKTGPAARAVLRCAETGEGTDAVPVGLCLGVVFHEQAAVDLEKAAGRMEKFAPGVPFDPDVVKRWHLAAVAMVERLEGKPVLLKEVAHRVDAILKDIGAERFAHLSDISALGYDQRLHKLGQALTNAASRLQSGALLCEVAKAKADVDGHANACNAPKTVRRSEMALRLLRWLASRREEKPAATFEEAARRYAAEGAFVDWARLVLSGGEGHPLLSGANARLCDEAGKIREVENQRFADLLKDWTDAGSKGDYPIRIENVIERLVAPLLPHYPVLVVLIDGMSHPIFLDLVHDLALKAWATLRPVGENVVRPAVATIPSVTQVSRASFFCGAIRQGSAAEEAKGFAEHPALLAHCKKGYPPIVFHKDLLSGSDPAPQVREAVASSRRIVAVVVNAVDDHLHKGGQTDPSWDVGFIKPLPALLHDAREAGRLVLLTSDHGHVLERATKLRKHDGGERFRIDGKAPEPDEVRIKGSRVLWAGAHELITPWAESVRYCQQKQHGYHGGVTPQEMLVPIALVSTTQNVPPGWAEATLPQPDWWEEEPARPVPVTAHAAAPPKESPQLPLFAAVPDTVPQTTFDWIDRLFETPTYKEQKKRVSRPSLSDTQVRAVLAALCSHGGKMLTPALARALSQPEFRLPGLIATMQRLLNVEGYPILSRDDASGTVELNRELLTFQFGLV